MKAVGYSAGIGSAFSSNLAIDHVKDVGDFVYNGSDIQGLDG